MGQQDLLHARSFEPLRVHSGRPADPSEHNTGHQEPGHRPAPLGFALPMMLGCGLTESKHVGRSHGQAPTSVSCLRLGRGRTRRTGARGARADLRIPNDLGRLCRKDRLSAMAVGAKPVGGEAVGVPFRVVVAILEPLGRRPSRSANPVASAHRSRRSGRLSDLQAAGRRSLLAALL